MKGYSKWSYRPYSRLTEIERRRLPFIVRLAPGADYVELEWLDNGWNGPHTVCYKPLLHDGPFEERLLLENTVKIQGLTPLKDYVFYIKRQGTKGESPQRLAQAGEAVGTVVNYLHPYDEAYAFSGRSLCSPSLVKLPSGVLLASMDVFAPGDPQNLSFLFRSDDSGATWRYVADLFPCFWGKLFCHGGKLYMLAHTTEYGNLVIGCSQDEGATWSAPVTLLPGAGSNRDMGPHKAPMPVVELNGRLYTGVDYGSWGTGGHANGLISIKADADLMIAENWSCTGFTAYNPQWPGTVRGPSRGCLEGNAVEGPDGGIYNVLRYQTQGCVPSFGKALILKGDLKEPEKALEYYKTVDFNGGSNSKFDLLRDPLTGTYWAIVNEIVYETQPAARTVVSLAMSRDMEQFRIVKRLIDFKDSDPRQTGFQYISFIIDGEDILFLSRTAMNKVRNHHDANYITFHRVGNFRQYL